MAETKGLVQRLTRQLASHGERNAKGMAVALLTKRGDYARGGLTAKGKAREALGAAGRAKDRAAKSSGRPASEYVYNSKTNSAKLGMVKPRGE